VAKKTKTARAKGSRPVAHAALVVRFRMETAVVEFETFDSDEEIKDIAENEARFLGEDEWSSVPFNEEDYNFSITTIATLGDPGYPTRKSLRKMDEEVADFRFVPLFADVNNGSGTVIWQPWFALTEPLDILMSDIGNDWLNELQSKGLNVASEMLDAMISRGGPLPSDKVLLAASLGLTKPGKVDSKSMAIGKAKTPAKALKKKRGGKRLG
jgi:hypothetical protein